MSTSDITSIEQQKRDISEGLSTVKLVESCTVDNGILRHSEIEKENYIKHYEFWDGDASFFVPASGSGSRMFSDIVKFLESKQETDTIIEFFEQLPDLALFQELPLVVREKFQSLQNIYLAEYLISGDGMQFPNRPKGLIPFHVSGNEVFNPFQEQFRQAMSLLGEKGHIHFTIQKEFETNILESLQALEVENLNEKVSFSYQESETDAYCFNLNGELIQSNGSYLRRPAGHGALLNNLDKVPTDLVFVKNIDNIQHPNKAALNEEVWKYCAGLLLQFKSDLKRLINDYSDKALKELNLKYQFLSAQELANADIDLLLKYAFRPSRVCGMVVNEGAPGGGPFWVEDKGTISKQIVEKVQISEEDKSCVEGSSHFNPVFIALSKTDVNSKQLNLEKFVDPTKFLVVNKPHEIGTIRYRELPGLWNGSMHFWNTIFVEIPKEVFSPVKSVFDLTKDAHRP